jgi:predicted nucleic acid-binding protein
VRIILDTNVVISGIFFAGPPYQILKAWREGKLHLLISEEILAEYRGNMSLTENTEAQSLGKNLKTEDRDKQGSGSGAGKSRFQGPGFRKKP